MIIIQRGFGLSIKRGHMFGQKESQRKMLSIKLPFLSIYVLNKKASEYWFETGRHAFDDPDWFIENHHAVRQAKRRAMLRKNQVWISTHEKIRAQYQGEIDQLQFKNSEQSKKLREQERDIQAYKKLVGGDNG